jgi:hypothetical protein
VTVLPYGEPVTVTRPGWTEDRYGNRVPDWTTATSTTYEQAVAFPGNTSEIGGSRESGVEVELTLLLPYGADVQPTDRITWRDSDYELVGDAYHWRSPLTAWTPGTEVPLRSFTG